MYSTLLQSVLYFNKLECRIVLVLRICNSEPIEQDQLKSPMQAMNVQAEKTVTIHHQMLRVPLLLPS